MSPLRFSLLASAVAAVTLFGAASVARERPCELPVRPLPLTGGLERPEAEISGLAWFGDQLVLLPQYPARFPSDGDGSLFALSRDAIEAYLDAPEGASASLAPQPIALSAPGLAESLSGFEGFEAIAFHGDRVFVTVETETDQRVDGYLLSGQVAPDLSRIELDVVNMARLPAQTDLGNLSYETVVVTEDRVLVFYENNGKANHRPHALAFDHGLEPLPDLRLEKLEYRITDATAPDERGRFWATNFFWPGADWKPGACPIAERFGLGASHAKSDTVERLVELEVSDDGVRVVDTPPVQLELEGGDSSRNWEGVARLTGRGFLVVTDEHPRSILGFVRR